MNCDGKTSSTCSSVTSLSASSCPSSSSTVAIKSISSDPRSATRVVRRHRESAAKRLPRRNAAQPVGFVPGGIHDRRGVGIKQLGLKQDLAAESKPPEEAALLEASYADVEYLSQVQDASPIGMVPQKCPG